MSDKPILRLKNSGLLQYITHMLIDSHCHLQKALLKGECATVLDRMQLAGVGHCITVGTGHEDWELYYRLASKETRVSWTVGMHPCDVGEDWEDHLQAIPSYFATEPCPVALGEIGLDHFHLSKYPDEAAETKRLQEAAFRAQLQLAYELDCPVVVHSRNAVAPCIELIDASGVDWRKVVFHCFTDGPEALAPILARGGRASFTGILTYRNAPLVREACLLQGIEMLMLETDAPYLTPEPVRGTPNEPANVSHIATYAAGLFGLEPAELIRRTRRATIEFFGLPIGCD
jgi:TatD DNase family protein